jgi:hypothetical protein
MGTYTQTIVVGASTYTVTKTVSNADLARFVTAVRSTYATAAEPLATDALAAAKYFDQVYSGAKDLVRRVEKETAATNAANAVTDITIT